MNLEKLFKEYLKKNQIYDDAVVFDHNGDILKISSLPLLDYFNYLIIFRNYNHIKKTY